LFYTSSFSYLFLYSFPTRRSSDLIIIFIVLLAILAITTFILIVFVYFDHSRIDNKDEVIEFVKKSSEIKQVTDVDYFRRFLNKRSEEHTSELQSRFDLVCRLLLEK